MKALIQGSGRRAPISLLIAARRILCLVFCAATVLADARFAHSAVVGTTGNVLLIAPPPSVVLSNFEDNTNARLFVEQSRFRLPESVAVDVTEAGVVDAAADLTPGQLHNNSFVDSYLLHADPIGPGYPVVTCQGTVTFNTRILGAMVTAKSLSRSDRILGSATTNYIPPTIYRGFEGPGFPATAAIVSDMMDISADFRTLSFLFHATSQYDQIRIVTAAVPRRTRAVGLISGNDAFAEYNAAVPEPSTALAATMAAVFAVILRRR